MAYQSFEDLKVYQEARNLKIEIFQWCKKLPPFENYLLKKQLVKSSRSVCSQIAEGHGKRSFLEKKRFAEIASGSLNETLNHLIDCFDSEYLTEDELNLWRLRIDKVGKLLTGYIVWLRDKANEPTK